MLARPGQAGLKFKLSAQVKKNLFILLSRVPYPLEKGDKLRAFNQIRELSEKHDIILCTLNDKKPDPAAEAFLRPYVKHLYIFRIRKLAILFRLLLNFLSDRPFQVAYFYSRRIHKRMQEVIDRHQPDYFYCQLIRTAEYLKFLPVNKTLDYQDVFSRGLYRRWQVAPIYKKILLRMEYRRVMRYEREVFELFDKKTIISYPDRELIPHPKKREIAVIPNGVDFTYFIPIDQEKIFDVIFTGNMAYPPNINGAVYLVRHVMPLVWKQFPGAVVVLAGATPSVSVRNLESDRVLVTGWVDDMREYYSKSKVFIAPMQIGTGLQNKVLEAMAMRLPCITSTLANDALNAPDGEALLVGKSPSHFAELIISLLNDPERCKILAENGYQFVRKNYLWSGVCERLNEVIIR